MTNFVCNMNKFKVITVYFVDEKDMCPMKGRCGSTGNIQYFNHDNTGNLTETSRSMSFKLGPKNQHVCDK